jgi:hypothetical protein
MRFLRALTGRVMPCGCLLGIYETYRGQIVTTIDACGQRCDNPAHRLHEIVSEPPRVPRAPAGSSSELSVQPPIGRDRSRS